MLTKNFVVFNNATYLNPINARQNYNYQCTQLIPILISGPLIESDLPRMRRRLDEINGQLRLLREHRSILPSEEYIRSTMPPPEPPRGDIQF